MKKLLTALSITACMFSIFPTLSNASIQTDQAQIIQRMNQNTYQGVNGNEMINNFNQAKAEFERMKNDSSRDATQSKADLDARFAKMKEDFANSGKGNNVPQIVKNNTLDMSIPEQQSQNNAGMGFNNQSSNASLGADNSLNNMDDKNYVHRTPSKKGYVDTGDAGSGDREYDKNLKKVMDESNISDSDNSGASSKSKGGNKNTLTKENVEKFIIATILLFIVMAVLYMMGKKKN